jgi:LysM repeat protein
LTKISDRSPGRIQPVPTPRARRADLAPATAPASGWTPAKGTPVATPPADPQGNFLPFDADAQAAAALDSLKQLAPAGITGVDPLQALDGVKDGKATITVPLQPGHYKAGGHGFDVKPGTVARIEVEVKDGRIVPARDAHDRPTGRGTQITVDPPLDLPLWITGKGAYVKDKGGSQAAFEADLGGWFDKKLVDLKSTKLKDVVGGLAADSSGKSHGGGSIPNGLIRADQVQFSAQVSMTDNVVKAGAATIDLAPGSRLTASGDGRHATLDGQVNLDRASLSEGGTQLKLGAGSAHVHADFSTQADGTMRLKTSVSGVNARVDQLSLEHARKPGDTDPDRLELANSQLSNGSLDLDATFKPQTGSVLPAMTQSSVRLHGDAEGSLVGAKLTMPDAVDTADVRLGPGRYKGSLDIRPSGNKIDVDIKGTTLDLRDLDGAKDGAKIGISSGHIEGDVHYTHDDANKDVTFSANARKVDFKIDGYQGHSDTDNVDFKSINVTGAGTVKLSPKGLDVDGDMHVAAAVNDLTIASRTGAGGVDLGKGTTLDGDATHFHSGGTAPIELTAKTSVDANVKSLDVNTAGLSAKAHGTLKGTADLQIGGGNASLVFHDSTANVTVDSAKLGSDTGAMGLDVAKGSTMKLNIAEGRFDSTAGRASGAMSLKPGSSIDATLDSGHMTVQGQRVELDKGSHARFDVTSLDAASGQSPALKGALTVDASVRTGALSGLQAAGIKVTTEGAATGKVKVSVPDVNMTSDGRVTYSNAHVALDAKVGNLKPGEVAPDAPVATKGTSPRGVLTPDQVKAESAAEIAGASTVGRPTNYDPLDAAKHIKNGTLQLEIPVDGRVGKGYWKSADFPAGTTMKLQLTVKDGKIVPDQTKAGFSKPGDAALWITAKGVHFDKDNSLRLQLGGTFGYEPAIPGMEHLPLDVGSLMDRLKSNGGQTDPNTLKAFKLDQARLDVTDATFTPGKMDVPGGWIDVGPDTKLSVHGTMKNATLSGRVQLNGVDITQDGVALKGSKGSSDISVAWNDGVATTTLDHLNVDTDYAVEKRSNGDYLKLARGHVSDGKMTMTVPFSVEKLQAKLPTSATLDVPKFSGTVDGARLSTVDKQGRPSTLEIGRAQVDGEVHIDADRVQVKGAITQADVAVRGFRASGANGAADIEYARMVGSGQLDFSSNQGLSLDANVSSLDVRANKAQANVPGAKQSAGRTRITGNGHVSFDTTKGLAVEGELHVDSDVSGELNVPKPATAPKPAAAKPAAAKPVAKAAPAEQPPVKRVTIQRPVQVQAPASAPAGRYPVASGDTLSRIAARYGVTVDALIAANQKQYPKITDPRALQIGWQLQIPAGVAAPS